MPVTRSPQQRSKVRPVVPVLKRDTCLALRRAGFQVGQIAAVVHLPAREVRRILETEGLLAPDPARMRIAPVAPAEPVAAVVPLPPAAPAEPAPRAEPSPRMRVETHHGLAPDAMPLVVDAETARAALARACRLHLADLVHVHGAARLTIGDAARSREPL